MKVGRKTSKEESSLEENIKMDLHKRHAKMKNEFQWAKTGFCKLKPDANKIKALNQLVTINLSRKQMCLYSTNRRQCYLGVADCIVLYKWLPSETETRN
jgi:hypothetical protein